MQIVKPHFGYGKISTLYCPHEFLARVELKLIKL